MKALRISIVRTMKSDATLIRAVLAGDGESFGFLVERYQQSVYALVCSLIHDFAAAEDITQEAFMTAYTRLAQLRNPAVFAAWLRRISINAARMWLRKRSRQEIATDMDRFIDSGTGGKSGLRTEIAEALASLPEGKREAAILCYMDGVSRKDAARFSGISETTLRKRLHDAKRLLQRRIVEAAEKNAEEYLLPKGFERRCICACQRALDAKRKEVLSMTAEKKDCGCGCWPPPDKKKTKSKADNKSKKGKPVKKS
jgi:RNA polymerase sigma factor (sigma-70 family)